MKVPVFRPIHELRFIKYLKLVAEAGKPADLGRKVDEMGTGEKLSDQYLSLINTRRRKIGDDIADRLERAMGKSIGWMDIEDDAYTRGNLVVDDRIARKFWLVSWALAGRLDELMSQNSDREYVDVVGADPLISERAFALRVRGDSMVNSAGGPTFPDGCIIVVDPAQRAEHGDNVVVQLPGAGEAVFKAYEFDGGKYYLKPLNSRYPIDPWPEGARIIGVVVHVQNNETIKPRSRR
ncbi:MAG: S24 family peptidase [Terriglobia bacterium]|nr:S24 family peptidase [Terriglobia bacterium]